jgi:hypothetical protein
MRKLKALGLRATLFAAFATVLSSCAAPPPVAVSGACPSLPEYPKDLQAQAADELERMPEGSVIAGIFIPDYGRMRDAVRECLKARGQ